MVFFDANINRIAAWVIEARGAPKSLVAALLEPAAQLAAVEMGDDHLRSANHAAIYGDPYQKIRGAMSEGRGLGGGGSCLRRDCLVSEGDFP